MHLKPELVPAFNASRLLVLSPFPSKEKRITAAQTEARNRFVGALADRIYVPHAAPNSRTLALYEDLRKLGKPLISFSNSATAR
jgi:predicted Rossmann fold nucleotide-binding protein DprA/Smf involved in DNA uptake